MHQNNSPIGTLAQRCVGSRTVAGARASTGGVAKGNAKLTPVHNQYGCRRSAWPCRRQYRKSCSLPPDPRRLNLPRRPSPPFALSVGAPPPTPVLRCEDQILQSAKFHASRPGRGRTSASVMRRASRTAGRHRSAAASPRATGFALLRGKQDFAGQAGSLQGRRKARFIGIYDDFLLGEI